MQTFLTAVIVVLSFAYLAWEWMPAHWRAVLKGGRAQQPASPGTAMAPQSHTCGACNSCGSCR